MTPVETFAGETRRRVRPRRLRPLDGRSALVAGGAEGRRLGRQRRRRATAPPPTASRSSISPEADWSRVQGARAVARRAADPSRSRTGRSQRAGAAGVPVIGDIELFARERAARAPARAVRRHHRHQRQVDHHGADRPCAEGGGPRGRARRQHRRADPRPAAAVRRPRPCDRVLVLSRSISRPRSRRASGCCINITPDHLDRHGDIEHYAAIKERLVASAEIALVGVDDEASTGDLRRASARRGPAAS